VTTTLSPPIRILAIVGVLAAVGLGVFVFTNSRSASSSSATPPVTAHTAPTTRPATPAKSATTKPVKPSVVLLPGLPSPVARALRYSKVVVVTLYARGGVGDRTAIAEARKGAKSVHAGFTTVNLANEKAAKRVGSFAGTKTAPQAVLIVKRPGKIVNRFDGFVDRQIVAQAARNAGARAR
jgi:hypothetical protein